MSCCLCFSATSPAIPFLFLFLCHCESPATIPFECHCFQRIKLLNQSSPPPWSPRFLCITKHVRETTATVHPPDSSSRLLLINPRVPVQDEPTTANYLTLSQQTKQNKKKCQHFYIVHNFKKYRRLIKYTCLVIFASSRKQIFYFFFFYNL